MLAHSIVTVPTDKKTRRVKVAVGAASSSRQRSAHHIGQSADVARANPGCCVCAIDFDPGFRLTCLLAGLLRAPRCTDAAEWRQPSGYATEQSSLPIRTRAVGTPSTCTARDALLVWTTCGGLCRHSCGHAGHR